LHIQQSESQSDPWASKISEFATTTKRAVDEARERLRTEDAAVGIATL
jgi:hypothetical protein